MRLPGLFHHAVEETLNALYPPRCVVCGRTDRLAADVAGFCTLCLGRLPHRRPPDRLLPCRAGQQQAERISGLQVVVAAYYEGELRDLLLRLKFHQDAGVHSALSALAERALRAECSRSLPWPEVVAAVPLHAGRLRERGYNQAGLIAADIAHAIGADDQSAALMRVRATRRQSAVPDRAERDANLNGAFRVADPLKIRGRSVVIVDDVLTSGATMQSCAESVARFAPAALYGLVVACGRPQAIRIDSVPYDG